jgi:hypothetical protein
LVNDTQMLASGWINDMFHPTHDGIYASPGDVFTIDTPARRLPDGWAGQPRLGRRRCRAVAANQN